MSEFKWINTDRPGMCAMCSTQLQPNERVLWSLVDKTKVWCRQCGSKFHNDDISPQKEGKGIDKRAGASTGNGTSDGATNASRARWELVTADDGVIVLRRSDR